MHFSPSPRCPGLLSVLRRWYVVVDILLIVCGGSAFAFVLVCIICIVLVAFIVVWLSCYSICSVDLPRGVVS